MNQLIVAAWRKMALEADANARIRNPVPLGLLCCAALALLVAPAHAQVITVNTSGKAPVTANSPVDRRYAQITPTHVPLPNSILDAKTRQELIRLLQSEQGFAMRPFPRSHKGLLLKANGKLKPAGEAYLNLVVNDGISAKPGERVVLSDVKIERNRIVFELNGGPDLKHRFLRHISIGASPDLTNPVVRGNDPDPVGARLTLEFDDHVPALTGADVKALLAPLISFDVKSPAQAFTDTLPSKLKSAILDHHVLVGMTTDMVLFAKGQPQNKTREMEGQMPFEEWIYGKPPQDVEFIRINGNRVIRVEVARVGEKPEIFTRDEVEGMMRTDGTPLAPAESTERISRVGDAERDTNKEAPAAPPSLRNPGETMPHDANEDRPGQKNVGVMKPVQTPKRKPELQLGANPDSVPEETTPAAPEAPSSAPAQPAPVGKP